MLSFMKLDSIENVQNANPTVFGIVTRTFASQNLHPEFDSCMGFFDFCPFLYGKKLEQKMTLVPKMNTRIQE
jgi:hypothetical protein